MPCTSRNKKTAPHKVRYNPYDRPYTSSNESIAPIATPLTRTLALYFDEEVTLNTAVSKYVKAVASSD
jgi:hypothetical protein